MAKNKNEMLLLREALEASLPGVIAQVDEPANVDGVWWLELVYRGHNVTVQWSPASGFGVSAPLLPEGYGEGPEEVFSSRLEAQSRVLSLLREKRYTIPPRDVFLRELRAMQNLTQEELAQHLGVQQAAISKLERKGNITIVLLRRYVEALGGKLELYAQFQGERIPLALEDVQDSV